MTINEEWDNFLRLSLLKNKLWFNDIIEFSNKIYKTSTTKVCPDKQDIFRMFKILKPDDIKVVLLFQDPYPQLKNKECVSNGIGLAANYLTSSLKHFFKAIDENVNYDNVDITMMSLVTQGVFSINKYLTVSRKPLSHSPYNMAINDRLLRWDLFMRRVLHYLDLIYENIVYIFFGSEAQELSYEINPDTNLIIKTSHPSPRGYKHGLMESKFAQRTNEYLKSKNKMEITWI